MIMNKNKKEHILYTKEDKDAPEGIKDRNGDIVLDLCKVCGKAESELSRDCFQPIIDSGEVLEEPHIDKYGDLRMNKFVKRN